MKISTKGRYALRMMLDLAQHKNDGFISLKQISSRQGISKKYLEQIVPLLNRTDILKTNRGYQGGYMLAKEPAEYTVADILRITEGSLAPVSCIEDPINACGRSKDCPTLYVWKGLNDAITKYLEGITLEDIVNTTLKAEIDNYSI